MSNQISICQIPFEIYISFRAVTLCPSIRLFFFDAVMALGTYILLLLLWVAVPETPNPATPIEP